jgi:hypothetical protein
MFYLTTHMPGWLWNPAVDFPLFISHSRLRPYKTLRPAVTRWALDSGGYTEITEHGRWRQTTAEYCADVAQYASRIGRLDWAAPQDWLCTPGALQATGLAVAEHVNRTVTSYAELVTLWPRYSDLPCPFIPVLQGWRLEDYLRCASLYATAGVDLAACAVVGIGSIAARQGTPEAEQVITTFADRGLAIHGFGVKTLGLRSYGLDLASADSLGWSYRGRRVPGCSGSHKTEANCLTFARAWRSQVLAELPEFYQARLMFLG